MLTSFGYTLDANILANYDKYKFLVSLHNYHNFSKSFWGIDVTSFKSPLTTRLALWTQPKEQMFYSKTSTPGALIALRYEKSIQKFSLYFEFESKSKGWVAGNPYLTAQTGFRIGFVIKNLPI